MTAAVLQGVHARTRWLPGDRSVLGQVVDGLRAILARSERLTSVARGECLYGDPMRSRAHAQYVMHLHRGHHCPRHQLAARYAMEARH